MAKTWGPWENIRQLGEGGQAHTYLVRTRDNPDSVYVLKRLKNPNRLARFKAEIEAGLQLSHRNVLRVLDSHLDPSGDSWFVAEYCQSGALSEPVRASLNLNQQLELFSGICSGVAHAHAKNIVHRDLKPDNVFIHHDATPVVGDFGLCHIAENGERFTFSGEVVVGSRWYAAPEAEDGRTEAVSPAADVYSLGKILYWLMTGRIFAREKHREEEYFFARRFRDSTGVLLYEILDRSICADPKQRFSSAADLLTSLEVVRRRISMNAHAIGKSLPQLCSYCGNGHYRILIRPDDPSLTAVRNFGIVPVGDPKWQILRCDYCGNIQLFRLDGLPEPSPWSR